MKKSIRSKLYDIIFEADTTAGKTFDVLLLIAIFISIIVVMLESVKSINIRYGDILRIIEWIITVFFTIEYFLRIYVVQKPIRYIFSFFGLIDLLSVLPSYIGIFISGTQGLMVIRALRLLRVFRIFKLNRLVNEGAVIIKSLKASWAKISVFLYAVIIIVIIIGTSMYLIEGEENGFTSIPRSIYWAIVTLTTVGFGDITPQTVLGQFLASIVMILGYAIIAVPTGIVSMEFSRSKKIQISTQVCPHCLAEGHEHDAIFCNKCGKKINED